MSGGVDPGLATSIDALKRALVIAATSGSLAGLISLLLHPDKRFMDGRLAQLAVLFGVATAGVDGVCVMVGRHYRNWAVDRANARRLMHEADADATLRDLETLRMRYEDSQKYVETLERRVVHLEGLLERGRRRDGGEEVV